MTLTGTVQVLNWVVRPSNLCYPMPQAMSVYTRLERRSMGTVSSMLETHPGGFGGIDRAMLIRCIETCIECAQACTACADADLSEQRVAHLTKCIRTNLDCADICATTSRVLSRRTAYDANVTRAVLEACAVTCRACGDECDLHATHHEHCRVCADVCRRCEKACCDLLASLG